MNKQKEKRLKSWTNKRVIAKEKALKEVLKMNSDELSNVFFNIEEDYENNAGNITNHDDAMPDLIRASACRVIYEFIQASNFCVNLTTPPRNK